RQLAEEARNTADRVAALVQEQRERLGTLARQDLMREVRIADLDKRIASVLAAAQKGDPACLALLVTNTDGRTIAASDPALLDRTAVAAPTLATVEAVRGPVFSEQYGRQSFEISVPIYNPDRPDELAGLLLGLFDWERETALLAQVRSNLRSVGLDVDVLVVDEGGIVLGGATRPGSPREFGASLRDQGWAIDGLDKPGFRAEPAVHAIAGHAALASPRWTVLVVEPMREALLPLKAMTLQLGVALAGVMISAAGLAGL